MVGNKPPGAAVAHSRRDVTGMNVTCSLRREGIKPQIRQIWSWGTAPGIWILTMSGFETWQGLAHFKTQWDLTSGENLKAKGNVASALEGPVCFLTQPETQSSSLNST